MSQSTPNPEGPHPFKHPARVSPTSRDNTASRALSVLAIVDEAGLIRLRAAYDPAPTPTAPASAEPAAAMGLPPAPPAPGNAPRR
ncbi:hypothetical protein GCM10018771_69780 [Streptomyces cellulosae]|nr:hypothetical protein GCM10018771_69780 [Streptomyces cellulosae]